MATKEPKDEKRNPAQDQTDASLESERKKTDTELAVHRVQGEKHADRAVTQARRGQDAVLRESRIQVDRATTAEHPVTDQAQHRERTKEDEAIEGQRSAADAALLRERDERERALTELLRYERESTDAHLLLEREHAEASVEARDDFLGMVSHDLRTLLGGVALQAQLLAREAADDEVGRQTLNRALGIQRFTAKMNRLINDLLDIVSIEAGRFSMVTAPHDAVRVLAETLDAFQPAAVAKGLTMTLESTPHPLLVPMDHHRVLQVLSNLVSNALKFTKEGGITLRVGRDDSSESVVFSVTDTGPGVPMRGRESIFDQFAQNTSHDRRGLGLGLYISKSIVVGHGGRIWIASTSAAGTTFCFSLPVKGVEAPKG